MTSLLREGIKGKTLTEASCSGVGANKPLVCWNSGSMRSVSDEDELCKKSGLLDTGVLC